MLKKNTKKDYIDMAKAKRRCLLEDYDHDHRYMLLLDIDEIMDEDD
jgi:hypothetical protein